MSRGPRTTWTAASAAALALLAAGASVAGGGGTGRERVPPPSGQPGEGLSAPALLAEMSRSLDRAGEAHADASVLAGIATEDESRRVGAAAERIAELAEAARRALGREPAAGREALAMRINLVDWRARVLRAATMEAKEKRSALAKEAAELLNGERIAAVGPESLRRVSLAAAMWLSGARAPEWDEPEEILQGVLELPVGEDPVTTTPRGVVAEALALKAGMAAAGKKGEALGAMREAVRSGVLATRGRADAMMELLWAEATARAGLEGGSAGKSLEPLLEQAEQARPADEEWVGSLAGAKLAAAARLAGQRGLKLDARIEMAGFASVLERKPDDASALAWMRRTADGKDPALAPKALGRLADALARSGKRAAARDAWLELDARFGGAQAEQGLRRAAEAYEHAGGGVQDPGDVALLEALLKRLDADERAGRWRLDLARVLLAAPDGRKDEARALNLLGEAAEFEERRGTAGASAEADGAALELVRAATGEPKGSAGPAGEAALRAMAAWAQRRKADQLPFIRAALADRLGEADAGREEARAIYASILGSRPPASAALRTRCALGLARLLSAAGKQAEAFGVLRPLAEEFDSPPAKAPRTRPPEFWAVWAEMLAIMAGDNAGGERSEQILLRIRQLETVDPTLGGGEPGDRIRRVEARLK